MAPIFSPASFHKIIGKFMGSKPEGPPHFWDIQLKKKGEKEKEKNERMEDWAMLDLSDFATNIVVYR